MACNPAVQDIRDGRIGQEAERPSMVVVEDKVANERRRDQTGESEDVGESVDIFVECLD